MHPKSLTIGARIKWRKSIPTNWLPGPWHVGIVKSFDVEADRLVVSLPTMAPNTYSHTYLALSEVELQLS